MNADQSPRGQEIADDEGRTRIAEDQPPFGRLLKMRIVSVEQDRIVGEMPVTQELANRNGVLHGGAISGFADNMGGTATFVNLKPGEGTTTIESKINFFRPVEVGDVLRGECVALHKGRRTMVWQTTMTRGDGKLVAIVIQTQMVKAGKPA